MNRPAEISVKIQLCLIVSGNRNRTPDVPAVTSITDGDTGVRLSCPTILLSPKQIPS